MISDSPTGGAKPGSFRLEFLHDKPCRNGSVCENTIGGVFRRFSHRRVSGDTGGLLARQLPSDPLGGQHDVLDMSA